MRNNNTPLHRRLRIFFGARIRDGGVACVRCGELIPPDGAWDLGHVDGDPTRYAGPEHARCNRATARHAAERRRVRTAGLW